MYMQPTRLVPPFKLAVMALVTALAACGGGSDDTSGGGGTTPPPTGSATGVLTDAAVQGVAFSTTSGVTGSTDAQGQYRYNPDDSVSFTLGALALGTVTASAVVTPIQLADGNDNVLQNLLVMLQSLDSDGVPGNGITIPARAAAAVTAGIDLASDPAAFASAANAGLVAAQLAGGISRPITTRSDAAAHFLAQSRQLLASQVWVGSFDAGAFIVFQRFGPDGEQLNAEIGPSEDGGTSGVEYGTALATAFDARGFALSPVLEIDTNGTWGLSHLSACERVRVEGTQLVYDEAPASCITDTSEGRLSPVPNDNSSLTGAWALDTANVVQAQHFVFWADGRFLMVDAIGDTAENSCGGPGVEYGTYSYNATTGAFKVLTVTVDTNGCAGLSDIGGSLASLTITLGTGGASASATDGTEVFELFRVSR